MLLHVGTESLRGNISSYARHFDLLEIAAEKGRLPRMARLGEMKRAVNPQFLFSVRLPRVVATLEWGDEAEQALAYALEVADVLGAGFLLLQTAPQVMPSARTKRRLAELVERIPKLRPLAWEPRGLWQDEDAAATADALGAVLVRDVSRETPPEGPTLYTRLRALGRSGVSVDAIERTAAAVLGAETACVLIEGDGAARAAATLRRTIGEVLEESASDDDEDDDDDDDDDDEARAEGSDGDGAPDDDAAEEDEG